MINPRQTAQMKKGLWSQPDERSLAGQAAPLCGSLQTHLGIQMPSGGGYIIKALLMADKPTAVRAGGLDLFSLKVRDPCRNVLVETGEPDFHADCCGLASFKTPGRDLAKRRHLGEQRLVRGP